MKRRSPPTWRRSVATEPITRLSDRCGSQVLIGLVLVVLTAVLTLSGPPAQAAVCTTPNDARTAGIQWLERNPHRWIRAGDVVAGDPSAKTTEAVVAAEALLALIHSGRTPGFAAQSAAAWLRGQESLATDSFARSIRALAAGGLDVSALQAMLCDERSAGGWGVVPLAAPGSYDTALGYAAIDRTTCGALTAEESTTLFTLGRHADQGWAGDQVDPTVEPGELVTTAEIVRALSVDYASLTAELDASAALLSSAPIPALAEGSSGTLEIAARLAALHALGQTHPGLEAALLARCDTGTAWASGTTSDLEASQLNALALLAIATHPTAGFTDPGYDPDQDGDGIRDAVDLDRDGDGLIDGLADPNVTDPTNTAAVDTDGDGTNDHHDLDDDDDGISDVDELAAGTDPTRADSDGDGEPDATDPCPTVPAVTIGEGIVWGIDHDGDGVCTPMDECDACAPGEACGAPPQTDPTDIADADEDGLCDGLDTDDDGDGYPDGLEDHTDGDSRLASVLPSTASPTDPYPGMPGDVAPLGDPDGVIDGADAVVLLNIMMESASLYSLPVDDQRIATLAADWTGDFAVDQRDALELLEVVRTTPVPEPSGPLLLAVGIVGLEGLRRLRVRRGDVHSPG